LPTGERAAMGVEDALEEARDGTSTPRLRRFTAGVHSPRSTPASPQPEHQ